MQVTAAITGGLAIIVPAWGTLDPWLCVPAFRQVCPWILYVL